jgi:hypothetical protein
LQTRLGKSWLEHHYYTSERHFNQLAPSNKPRIAPENENRE